MSQGVRGVLLLAGVLAVMLKLAGVLTWPWLAVLAPLLLALLPQIFGLMALLGFLAMGAGTLMIGAVAGVGMLIHGAVERMRRHKLQRRQSARLAGGGSLGPWDERL